MNHLLIIAVSISSMFTTDFNNREQDYSQEDKKAQTFHLFSPLVENPCNEGDDEDLEPLLSGRVSNIFNVPIYHACIEIKTLGGSSVAIIGSDINGHYYFNSVASGTYNMFFSAPGYTTQVIPVTVSGTPQPVDAVLL
jgi:hypothetical protein